MKARKVAAQFAAYVWYENTQAVERTSAEKARFARNNWRAFLPVASDGVGRLLLRINRAHARRERQAV